MELLIPGLILVALMVWASTRIKRNAAAAFAAEHIETDQFAVDKPEGFLHVLNDSSGLVFHSYSKEFGKVGTKEFRQATIEIEKHTGRLIDELAEAIEEESESIDAREAYIDGGERAVTMRSTLIFEGGEYLIDRKLVTRGSDVFDARVSVLADHAEVYADMIEHTLDRIRIK